MRPSAQGYPPTLDRRRQLRLLLQDLAQVDARRAGRARSGIEAGNDLVRVAARVICVTKVGRVDRGAKLLRRVPLLQIGEQPDVLGTVRPGLLTGDGLEEGVPEEEEAAQERGDDGDAHLASICITRAWRSSRHRLAQRVLDVHAQERAPRTAARLPSWIYRLGGLVSYESAGSYLLSPPEGIEDGERSASNGERSTR